MPVGTSSLGLQDFTEVGVGKSKLINKWDDESPDILLTFGVY